MTTQDAFHQLVIVRRMIPIGAKELPAWEGEQKLESSLKESGLGFPNDDTFIERFRKVTPRNLACAGLDILMPEILRRKSGTRRALSSTAWLDGLRGWAALVVCMVHLTVYTHQVCTTYYTIWMQLCCQIIYVGEEEEEKTKTRVETTWTASLGHHHQLTSQI